MAQHLVIEVEANGMVFRCRGTGLGNKSGEPVILLHGFPETSIMWAMLMERLADEGYRCFAPDQRGYSPGARLEGVENYTSDKLVADIIALADILEFQRFHLIGHDWGSAVGWIMLALHPERVQSWTAMSVPHMDAFVSAIADDPDQQQRSQYIGFFMMPEQPEKTLLANDLEALRTLWAAIPSDQVEEYVMVFSQPGALTAALNWYRANSFGMEQGYQGPIFGEVSHPTLLIWGNQDIAIGRVAVERTNQYMKGPCRLAELNAGHWLIQEEPDHVYEEILQHLKANPIS
ncbi:MAG: alpha/beta hydrolase [Dehalococcoidia bacterium]|nr:MAG: alpha/beta hydrolase [Dehalococcoidia bacterium]